MKHLWIFPYNSELSSISEFFPRILLSFASKTRDRSKIGFLRFNIGKWNTFEFFPITQNFLRSPNFSLEFCFHPSKTLDRWKIGLLRSNIEKRNTPSHRKPSIDEKSVPSNILQNKINIQRHRGYEYFASDPSGFGADPFGTSVAWELVAWRPAYILVKG